MRVPGVSARLTKSVMSGPGVMTSTSTAAVKVARVATSGMKLMPVAPQAVG